MSFLIRTWYACSNMATETLSLLSTSSIFTSAPIDVTESHDCHVTCTFSHRAASVEADLWDIIYFLFHQRVFPGYSREPGPAHHRLWKKIATASLETNGRWSTQHGGRGMFIHGARLVRRIHLTATEREKREQLSFMNFRLLFIFYDMYV